MTCISNCGGSRDLWMPNRAPYRITVCLSNCVTMRRAFIGLFSSAFTWLVDGRCGREVLYKRKLTSLTNSFTTALRSTRNTMPHVYQIHQSICVPVEVIHSQWSISQCYVGGASLGCGAFCVPHAFNIFNFCIALLCGGTNRSTHIDSN